MKFKSWQPIAKAGLICAIVLFLIGGIFTYFYMTTKSSTMLYLLIMPYLVGGYSLSRYFFINDLCTTIDEEGVRLERKTKVIASIPWKNCKEIGVINGKNFSNLYVSRVSLTPEQRKALPRSKDILVLTFTPELLAAVQKYAPTKLHIHNLKHLREEYLAQHPGEEAPF